MSKTKILFINTEIEPYMTSGRMSDIGRQLPQAMHEAGHEVRVFTPRFGIINERRNQLHEVIRLSGQNININETDHPLLIKVASLMPQRLQVYFIDNEEYFSTRKAYCDDSGKEYSDQVERCLFFARGVAETVRKLRWTPNVIYCQGWFAAVAPMLFKKAIGEFSCFRKAKIVFALYDNAFKTPWPEYSSKVLKLEGMTKADIADIKDKPIDYQLLCSFVTKFCDGIVLAEVGQNQAIVDLALQSDKKVLDVTGDKSLNVEAYSHLFESFLQTN